MTSINEKAELNGESSSSSSAPGPTIKSGYINLKGNSKSAFTDAFSGLKKSKFYEEPSEEIKKAAENVSTKTSTSKPYSKNCVVVSSRQRGNPILKYIRNVPWEYGEIVPDYVMGGTTCALFLSLRYHNLNPNYVHDRLKQLGHQYQLRVLLILIDVKDPHHELKQLTKICVMADMTMMLAWNAEEAGRVIEIYKSFEHKPPDLIMEKQETNSYAVLIDTLTSIRSVNRTDAMTLLSTFGSLEKIVAATQDELTLCPGLGPQKANRLYQVLHQSFKKQPSPQKKITQGSKDQPSPQKKLKQDSNQISKLNDNQDTQPKPGTSKDSEIS